MGTLRIDNTNGTGGDTSAQRARDYTAGQGVWAVIDPSPIPVGTSRDYSLPAATYYVGVAFGVGPVTGFALQVVTDGNVTTITLA